MVSDLEVLDVAAGVRVLVASDLHLTADPSAAARAAAAQLAEQLNAWEGPGVLALAGDVLELLVDPPDDPLDALTPYGDFASAARRFAASSPGRHVVYVLGNHDIRLAWDDGAASRVAAFLGATLALAVDLRIETAAGARTVRIEHGHRFDVANSYADPRNRHETPIGHHVAAELAPLLSSGDRRWLAGAGRLGEPLAFPRFVVSRLLYRRLVPWLALAAIGPALALFLGPAWLGIAAVVAVVELLGLVTVIALASDRAWSRLASPLSCRGQGQNDAAREAARRLVDEGYAGLVTGHSHHAELTPWSGGFYANTGCCTEVVDRRPTRRGWPAVFGARQELTLVELEGGADIVARLAHSEVDVPGTRLERLAQRRPRPHGPTTTPPVVASLADGSRWPRPVAPELAHRRARRIGAGALLFAGLLDLGSALSPPLRSRLQLLRRLFPLTVPQAATALVAVAGLALLLLARGVRRGQRRALWSSVALLLASAVLHLAKGFDVEEAAVALTIAAYLSGHRGAFRARSDPVSIRRGLLALVLGPVVAVVTASAGAELFTAAAQRPPLSQVLVAAAERLAGITQVALPEGADEFLTPGLLAVGVALAAYGLWLVFRPVISSRRPERDPDRARQIVRRYGGDTLAYFALRDDKEHFFQGESLVAYGLHNGICLVSPDPIGPAHERLEVWAAFRRYADGNGWTIAVLGATQEWLPIYRLGGMRELYVGDEGIVDVQAFSMDGGQFKGLRQAVNRVAKYGYRIEFHDPARLDPAMQAALRDVMTKSRRGDVERGFSMTLGRVFDPDDVGLLLAVAVGPDGLPAAFAQFVPAPGIDGWSLDLMRRSDAPHPNGVTDFVVVKTIEHLRDRGFRGLGLNFATMRSVIAGEAGDGIGYRAQRWMLRKLSASMQIESLWRYNAKFAPTWQPRYAVYDAPENVVPAALAVAKAESFWELPVIGRWLVPAAPAAPAGPSQPVPDTPDRLEQV